MLRLLARALSRFPDRRGHKTVVEKLTVLIDENTVDLSNSSYSPDIILLDEKSVTAELAHLSETDQYLSRISAGTFLERVAHRVAWRMSGPFSVAWGAPREMICEAIQFQLWIELCTIIPLRRLARVIARREPNKAVLMPFPKLDLECLKQWESNELGPLILCWALQKQGCRAYLVAKGPINVAELSIKLHPSILALPPPGAGLGDGELPKGRPIIATEGVRGLDILVNEVEHASFLAGHNQITSFAVPKDRLVGIGPVSQPTGFEIRLRQDDSNDATWGLTQYSAEWPKNPLSSYVGALLGPHFPFMVARARSLVANAAIKEAYVCDHLFLGPAILAHAVKERGGSVILWPHSANPSNVVERDGKYFDKVVVLTQEARKSWKRLFPDKPVTIQPRCMLPPQRQPREFKPSEPLTVVVFGGEHFLGRLPLFRVDSHIQCYKRFFLLASSAEFVRLKFKPKGGTETADWLVNVTNNLIPVDIETRAATQLDYPNMIFVTIGHGSTALLEGIASGVPCMIVREQAIQDYTCIDGDVVPTGDVELVFRLIEQCRNMTYYNGLLEAQIKWLSRQTSAGSMVSNDCPPLVVRI